MRGKTVIGRNWVNPLPGRQFPVCQSRPLSETLERRLLMSVSTVNGWTNITLPQDARAVYVSSSAGDDANAGFSESSPVRTLTKAVSLMRQYFGDHLLLKRGDVWNESLGMWGARGGGADQVSVVSGYGSGPRPLLQTTDSAFRIHNGTAWHTLRSSGCT